MKFNNRQKFVLWLAAIACAFFVFFGGDIDLGYPSRNIFTDGSSGIDTTLLNLQLLFVGLITAAVLYAVRSKDPRPPDSPV